MKVTILNSLTLVVALSACGKSSSSEGAAAPDLDPQSLTYYKDIKPLMDLKCSGCHSPGGLAGIELNSYARVKALRASIKEAVASRRMPPWLAEGGHQTYRDDLSLTTAEIDEIVGWIDLGLREGEESDYVEPTRRNAFQPDLTLHLFSDNGSFLPDQDATDEYRCFLIPFEDKLGENDYITGFTAQAGNKKIVHHLIAYTAAPEILPILRELDEAEDGLGYRCFGGAIPDRLGNPAVQSELEGKYPGIVAKLNNESHWLAHWAPGMDGGYTFPRDTGIRVPKGGAFVIQVHYYTADAKGESDQDTQFAVKLARSVAKPAFYYPLTKREWLTSRMNNSMVIPAQQGATFSTEATLDRIATYGKAVLNLQDPVRSLEVHSANIHMHAIGASGRVTLVSPSASPEETLLNIPEWDLHWQRDFQFEQPKIVTAEDWPNTINRVSCTYQNDRAVDTFGGLGSMDEMCFNFGYFAFSLSDQL